MPATSTMLRQRRRPVPPPSLADQLRAILNAPWNEWPIHQSKPCRCVECRRRRTTSFTCNVCGHTGAPIVDGSDCATARPRRIARFRAALQAIARREPAPAETEQFSEAQLRELLRQEEAAEPCRSGACGHCTHGLRVCRVCVHYETQTEADTDAAVLPWRMVRELRAVLVARGLL